MIIPSLPSFLLHRVVGMIALQIPCHPSGLCISPQFQLFREKPLGDFVRKTGLTGPPNPIFRTTIGMIVCVPIPGRSYRLRPGYEGWWIVERRPGGEMLRTWTATTAPNLPHTDAALREAWQAAAFPRR
jgi:hypothetical protein